MKILVVDDDALAGEMTAAVLEEAGHGIVLAENAIEAMEKLNDEAGIALIVSDMNMPMVSGIDLFRDLREQGVDIPFILLTGDAPGPLKATEPRLDDCLTKDFSLETALIQSINTVMARRAG
ncbi:MAG: response [Rhodospirillaceae bacterium]|nr:MAG: response [Rhodospirillaceae bacterium]TNC95516.1 MAG: response regulator [Stygiobacter sp.]